MPYYTFKVNVCYHTDKIYAETEEEAIAIVNEELQYCGEEEDIKYECIAIEDAEKPKSSIWDSKLEKIYNDSLLRFSSEALLYREKLIRDAKD